MEAGCLITLLSHCLRIHKQEGSWDRRPMVETALKAPGDILISLLPCCSDKPTLFLAFFSGVKRGRQKTSWQPGRRPGDGKYCEHENFIWAIKALNHRLYVWRTLRTLTAALCLFTLNTRMNGDSQGWVCSVLKNPPAPFHLMPGFVYLCEWHKIFLIFTRYPRIRPPWRSKVDLAHF